jgi:hypothetical protein
MEAHRVSNISKRKARTRSEFPLCSGESQAAPNAKAASAAKAGKCRSVTAGLKPGPPIESVEALFHSREDFGGLGFSPAEKRSFKIGFSR